MAHKNSVSAGRGGLCPGAIELADEQSRRAGRGDSPIWRKLVRSGSPRFKAFLVDPSIRPEERWQSLQRTFQGRSSELFVNLLGVLMREEPAGADP